MTTTPASNTVQTLDIETVRAQFPVLHQQVHGKPLVSLDNAATTHKPERVIEAVSRFYREDNANVHRGLHELNRRATDLYEQARAEVASFVNAPTPASCVFTSGVTDSMNLIANTLGRSILKPGDRVLLTEMEHHSNIVPWQMIAEQMGAEVIAAPVTDDGELDMAAFESMLDERVRIVSCVHTSNTLGTINPVERIVKLAHEAGAKVALDAAQASAHVPIDVQAINCDFLAISGHKAFGPTGIGAVYIRPEIAETLPPYRGGGEMIASVSFKGTTYAEAPMRFEAGTPNIAGAIGLAEALRFIKSLPADAIHAHEQALVEHGTRVLSAIEGLRLIGTAPNKVPVFSFLLENAHPYDVGPVLDHHGVAVRTGHHCTQPLMDRFGIPGTVRASCALYSTTAELDTLADAIRAARDLFS